MGAASGGHPVVKELSGFSRGIDLGRLERETRRFLAVGLVCGIVLGAALSRCVFYGVVKVSPTVVNRDRPMRVDFVEIHRELTPAPRSEPSSRTTMMTVEKTDVSSPTVVAQPGVRSIVPGVGPEVTSRAIVPDVAERSPALGDTAALARKQRLHRKVPIEEREREMAFLKKKYGKKRTTRAWTVFEAEKSPASQDFTRFGIPFNVPNPFSKNKKQPPSAKRTVLAADSLGGASRTSPEQALLEKLRADDFKSLSEPDVRFLIVMWRDTYFDESRLSLNDWAFLTKSGLGGHFTSAAYLKSMEDRGLVKQAVMNGGVYYRTQLAREELLKALERNSTQFANSPRSAEWMNLVSLVGSCYDFTHQKVILPE